MFTTDSLFFLTLFIIPGAMKIIYDIKIRKVPPTTSDEKLRMSQAVIFSTIIFAVNAQIFQKLYYDFMAQENVFTPMWRWSVITAINIVSSVIYYFIWNCVVSFLISIVNFSARKFGKAEIALQNSAREIAFSKKMIGNGPQVVRIISDDTEVVGLLDAYNRQEESSHGITLKYCNEISDLFEWDKEQKEKDRLFNEEKYTYIDVENNYRIVFYDMHKYNDYSKLPPTSISEDEVAVELVADAPVHH